MICLNRGETKYNIHFEKDCYLAGEEVEFTVEIDN